MTVDVEASAGNEPRWRDVFRVFVKLGFIGFGGPAAHIAMMRTEVVQRRPWMDDQEFLDAVGACNLVPGPNSTELALHVGLQRAGWRGFAAAAIGFILPAVGIVLGLAWLYDRYGTTPTALDLSYGITPVIVAIVGHAVVGLGRTAIKSAALAVIAVAAAITWLAGVSELAILAAGAVVGTAWHNRHRLRGGAASLLWLPLAPVDGNTAPDVNDPELWRLGWVFLKIGALLYGSGYVLISFMERDLVRDLGWLTERQLLDAVAVGQVTPGPVFTTATFVGYQIAGFGGAVIATVAIFAPAFVFVALLSRVVPLIRRSPWAAGALDGVVAASLGLMAAALIRLAEEALIDPLTIAVAVLALVVLIWRSPNTLWLVLAGAAIGLANGAFSS